MGELGTVSLTFDPDVKPKYGLLEIQIALQSRVKNELDSLCDRGIISSINEPTKWVSQMAAVEKLNGEVRIICVDPQPLNDALQQ